MQHIRQLVIAVALFAVAIPAISQQSDLYIRNATGSTVYFHVFDADDNWVSSHAEVVP